ncbi:tyrosine-type recombinase/integrase [Mesorhizobium sp. WSM3862]|uniref:tyrosine-type recombinase/integrase n=1 Tax=Mesorhizobium sp. WSM3862 TaxID=632858 RepID=UPI0032AF3F82
MGRIERSNEMEALLAVPDRRTLHGRAEHALLLFLYNTGARVSEATRLQVSDLQIGRYGDNHALVTLCCKGDKIRQCRYGRAQRMHLANSFRDAQAANRSSSVVIASAIRGSGFTGSSSDVRHTYQRLPQGRSRPHMIRHTSACHLLQAGVDLNTIRAWLGHVSLETTNIYAEIDIEMNAKAMALCEATTSRQERPWKEDKGVECAP